MFEVQAHLEKRRQESVKSQSSVSVADEALRSQMSFYSNADSSIARLNEKTISQCVTIPCKNQQAAAKLTRRMLSAGVECQPFVNAETKEITLAVPDSQVKKAEIVLHQYQMQHLQGQEVSKEMLYHSSRNHLEQIMNISSTQISMFQDLCKENQVNYHVDGPKEGKYSMTFDKKDSEKVAQMVMLTALDLSGKTGEFYERLNDYREREHNEIMQRIKNPDLLTDLQMQQQAMIVGKTKEETAQMRQEFRDDNKTVYLVDRDSSLEIIVNKRLAKVHNGRETENAVIRRDKNDNQKFARQVNQIIQSEMTECILLTVQQYQTYSHLKEEERSDFLREIEKQHGYPAATKDEIQEFRYKEANRDRLQKALSEALYMNHQIDIVQGTSLQSEMHRTEQEYLMAHQHDNEMVVQALNVESLDWKTEEHLLEEAATAFDRCDHIEYTNYLLERKGEQIIHASEYELNAEQIEEMIEDLRRKEQEAEHSEASVDLSAEVHG